MKNKQIIDKLSLAQKAALMSGKNIWETVDIPELNIPSLFLADGPHGLRKQLGAADHLGLNESVKATCFPTSATIANSWDEKLGEKIGAAIGVEAAKNNVQVILGPGLNIKRNPLCGRNFEYFSEDPYQSGKLAASYVRGIQSQGVAASPKHLAVNSQETRRMASNSVIDERTYREIYLTAFEIVVKEAKAKIIMSSYNEINGVYANENSNLLQDILVDDWGFDGFVVTDWGGSNDHVLGVKNGSHLEMPSTAFNGQKEIIDAVTSGKLSEKILDQRVDKLLTIIFKLSEEKQNKEYTNESHHKLACQVAKESIVLLKNKGDILPLKAKTSVGLIGDFADKPRYQGAGSSVVNPTQLDTTLDLIKKTELNYIGYAQGYQRVNKPDQSLIDEAVALANKVDVVLLYVGLDEISESEGLDRATMNMPANQIALIEALAKVNSNIVAVMSAGSVVDLNWDKHVAALVHGYLGGQAGAGAMLDVLQGKYNPSGKLSETYPMSYNDIPSSKQYPEKGRHVLYKEGLFVGYRYFETANVPVKYCYGYGLSYTSFTYSNLNITPTRVTFTITNTGDVEGSEIAQLYVSKEKSGIYRPVKELKGFAKIKLAAGESRHVEIPIDDKAFRYFNVKTNKWEVEGGSYNIQVGANVKDIRLNDSIELVGTTTVLPQDSQKIEKYFKADITSISNLEFEALLDYPVPVETFTKGQQLQRNDPLLQMQYAKSGLARLVFRVLDSLIKRSEKKAKPNLNLLFNYNMPFRAIAKMTNGMFTMEMVDSILVIVNGKFFAGLYQLLKANNQRRKIKNKIQREEKKIGDETKEWFFRKNKPI